MYFELDIGPMYKKVLLLPKKQQDSSFKNEESKPSQSKSFCL
jgi:hypothetical protein